MKISRIELEGFMSHASSVVELPATGVVFVSGPNGAGKSSLIEAPSVAGWNATLRKKPAWSGPRGLVRLLTYDDLMIERTKTKSATKLKFARGADQPVAYENTTKAQEALEGLIGLRDIWRRTNVLSAQDAQQFTLATDSERKRMLEVVLHLTRFDEASAACGRDLREAERQLQAGQIGLASTKARLDSRKERLADAERRLSEHTTPKESLEALHSKKDAIERQLAPLKQRIAELGEEIKQARKSEAELGADMRLAAKQLQRLEAGECGECGKPYTDAEVTKAKKQQAKAKKAYDDCTTELEKLATKHEAEAAQAEAEMDQLRDQLVELRHLVQEGERLARERSTLQRDVRDMARDVEDAHDAHDEASGALATIEREAAVLRATNKVLSLNGVRAHLLHKALHGIESIANVWLNRVACIDGKDLQLRLTPYSEKATGGVKDAISLEIEGAGAGHGWGAASGGERRRIDIALMFALAEVAEAAHNIEPGTMFLDEVLDSIDAAGIDAICDVITEIAQSRCVLIISHNPLVRAALNRQIAVEYEIVNGTVKRKR